MNRTQAIMLWKRCCMAALNVESAFEVPDWCVDPIFQTFNQKTLVTFEQWIERTGTPLEDDPAKTEEKVSQANAVGVASLQAAGVMQPKSWADAEAVLSAKANP